MTTIVPGDHPDNVTWSQRDEFTDYVYLTDENGAIITDENDFWLYVDVITGEDEGTILAGNHPSSATWSGGDSV